ncbi:PREDICTED: protein NETWORKED 2D-like [Nelumbo nucifera]|uniref:NAB domain-containing protein n=2 Tax=Nelumbo nucifera TaxID=4432 RepID=A0A822XE94_NELNU|nr:PREDICTED: protein NETWORKED 2D-like [Nelumbo nucifera]DAD18212.1 TPA_asm: hypothetical protein HUJ06_019675 [Nelumbo nucifera]
MLQRAANNACSWWYASHIRTKQSKWLQQSLQDMEEKVKYTLKLIEEDGDSFAKRAEMYYRKRPELVNFVEETYRAYRGLAERYDHISGELQSANKTLATICPEQFQFTMDEDDEVVPLKMSTQSVNPITDVPKVPKPNTPKIPKKGAKTLPTLHGKKSQSKKTTEEKSHSSSARTSKVEAREEIDRLQKGILALQTEKEFFKSSYESSLAKYWEIEDCMIEMQDKVCSLQDDFGVETVIEDDEARHLMAVTALKSCEETLIQLKKKHKLSAKEAKVEYQRIKDARTKLKTLRCELLRDQIDQSAPSYEKELLGSSRNQNLEQVDSNLKKEELEMESTRDKVREHSVINSDTSLTVSEMVEKIDELVNEVMNLEIAVSRQTALMKRLKFETDELHEHLRSLEEDKATLIDGSNKLGDRLRKLDAELKEIQDLERNLKDQNNNLQMKFTEAHRNLNHLSENLHNVKSDEEVETTSSLQEVESPDFQSPKSFEEDQTTLIDGSNNLGVRELDAELEVQDRRIDMKEKADEVQNHSHQDEEVIQPKRNNSVDDISEKSNVKKEQSTVEKQESSQAEDNLINVESEEEATEQDDLLDLKELLLIRSEDREHVLLKEYTSVVQNYKELKRKLSELARKNRDSHYETMVQLRELKSANAMKDEEIKSLRQKISSLQRSSAQISIVGSKDFNNSQQEKPHDGMQAGADFESTNFPTMPSDNQPASDLLEDLNVGAAEMTNKSIATTTSETQPKQEGYDVDEDIKVVLVDKPQTVSSIEEKFRRAIDDLLEENLDFWFRFCTSFHQVQKFQTEIQDLQDEFSKLKENKNKEGNAEKSVRSDARPIYKHLREILTELTLWLEQNTLLKDELMDRFSSLCKIQEEISRMSQACSGSEDQLSKYQAAKFQGEVLNMKQENNKVAHELQRALLHVRHLQSEIEKTLLSMNEEFGNLPKKKNEEFGQSGSKSNPLQMKHSSSSNRPKVPLRTFIFGSKPKKPKPSAIFGCVSPAMHKLHPNPKPGRPL